MLCDDRPARGRYQPDRDARTPSRSTRMPGGPARPPAWQVTDSASEPQYGGSGSRVPIGLYSSCDQYLPLCPSARLDLATAVNRHGQ
eukprot:757130-Hanusia_phi.AAC.2